MRTSTQPPGVRLALVTVGLALAASSLLAGCNGAGKDETINAAPPPGPNARPEPPNPGKLQRLPGKRTPSGG